MTCPGFGERVNTRACSRDIFLADRLDGLSHRALAVPRHALALWSDYKLADLRIQNAADRSYVFCNTACRRGNARTAIAALNYRW